MSVTDVVWAQTDCSTQRVLVGVRVSVVPENSGLVSGSDVSSSEDRVEGV